ncbi:MAG TPA: hypothetical protein VK752_13790 [Bryobacteraceae bacterium]|jgi:hypothetical protein|nr:hypothetical protein [Bryobacteraceae bacterium]
MVYLMLIALATLIYAGAWMFASPSRALTAVTRVANEISRYDRTTMWVGAEPIRESVTVRVACRFVGLGLILLSVIRLTEIT